MTINYRHIVPFLLGLALAVTAFLTASCDEGIHERTAEDLILSPSVNVATKGAIVGDVFPADRTLWVSAYHHPQEGRSGEGMYFTDSPFLKDGGTWKSAAGGRFWPFAGTLDFTAYCADELGDIVVTHDAAGDTMTLAIPDNSIRQCDILVGGAAAQTRVAGGNVLPMHHACALLTFRAEAYEDYDIMANVGVSIDTITVLGVRQSGTLTAWIAEDPEEGYCRWTDLGEPSDMRLIDIMTGSYVLNHGVPMDASGLGYLGIGGLGIIVPEQDRCDVRVSYTLHNGYDMMGNTIDTHLSMTSHGIGRWEEGTRYVYRLQFGGGTVRVEPVMGAWTAAAATI